MEKTEKEIWFGDIERIEGAASDAATKPYAEVAHGAHVVSMLGIIARELRRSAVAAEKMLTSNEIHYAHARKRDAECEIRVQRIDEENEASYRAEEEYQKTTRAFALESISRKREVWKTQDDAEKPIEERLAAIRSGLDQLLEVIHGRVGQ